MWFLFPLVVWANPKSRPTRSLRSTRMADYALAIQRPELNIVERENGLKLTSTNFPRKSQMYSTKRLASRGIGGSCAARKFVEGGNLPDRSCAT